MTSLGLVPDNFSHEPHGAFTEMTSVSLWLLQLLFLTKKKRKHSCTEKKKSTKQRLRL